MVLYSVSFLDDTFIFAVALIPFNAFVPTDFNRVDFTLIVPSFLHPLNASIPIVCTFAPIVTVLIFLFVLRALSAIDVTRNFLLPSLIVFGMVTFLAFGSICR